MTEDQKKNLETQHWGIANLLRGKISADDSLSCLDYILGFIFFKYLLEKQHLYTNELLVGEEVTEYTQVTDDETLKATEIKENYGRYRSESARLKYWDYSQIGVYFITICSKNKSHNFGKIIDGEMELSEIGKITKKYWLEIPNHFKNVTLDQYVIMPNHIHGILIINNDTNVVETTYQGVYPNNVEIPKQSTPKLGVATEQQTAWKPATIGVIINQYKRIVTINARKTNPKFAWQPRYHDHIIRDDESLKRIREYTINNPLKWHLDKYYEK